MEEPPKKVEWSCKAKDHLLEIFESWEALNGFAKADAVTEALVVKTRRLAQFPELGAIQEHELSGIITIRYLVESTYKIYYTYEAEQNMVKIRGIKDSRQNPDRLRNP